MAFLWTGGLMESCYTRCWRDSLHLMVKMKMNFSSPLWSTTSPTLNPCPKKQFPSAKGWWQNTLQSVWAAAQRGREIFGNMLSFAGLTGYVWRIEKYSLHSNPKCVERGQRTLTSSSHAHSHNWPLLMSWLSPTSTRLNLMDFPSSTLNLSILPSSTVNKMERGNKKGEWMWIYLLPQNYALAFTLLSNKC